MTPTIPNLWEGKFSQHAVTPLAVFRTHAGNFNAQSGGLLRAEVEHRVEDREDGRVRAITFDIFAPSLDYRQGVFTAEHQEPGAYPVTVHSGFLKETRPGGPRLSPGGGPQIRMSNDPETNICYTQAELIKTLDTITESFRLRTLIESLFAQINEANPDE